MAKHLKRCTYCLLADRHCCIGYLKNKTCEGGALIFLAYRWLLQHAAHQAQGLQCEGSQRTSKQVG